MGACRSATFAPEPEVLSVWLAADYARAATFERLNQEFTRDHPGVQVQILGVPWANMPAKVKTAVIGGVPPDIAHHHAAALGAQGFAEALDSQWETWARSDALGQDDDFLPGAIDEITWQGHRYGVPLDINCAVLIYNQDSFDRAHLPYPAQGYTFAKLEADLVQLNDPPRQYAIAFTSNAWHSFSFVRAAGGSLLSDEGGAVRATLDRPEVVAGIDFLGRLSQRNLGARPSTREGDFLDTTQLFIEGKAAVIYTGPWDFQEISARAPNLRWGASPFPSASVGQAGGAVQGGGSLFVPKGARHRELAFEWMTRASSPKYARMLLEELGRHPVRRSLYDDPRYRTKAMQAFVAGLPRARPYKLEAFPVADQAFADAVKATLYGQPAQVALASAQRRAQWFVDLVEGQ